MPPRAPTKAMRRPSCPGAAVAGPSSLAKAAFNGAALGFIAYATYDLSNQATLRGWDVKLTLIDMAWGTVLTATASAVGYIAASRVG